MTEAMNLEKDISVARQWLCPVLITAPPEYALAVAHVIAVGGDKEEPTRKIVMWNGAAIASAALGDRRAIETTTGETVLVVHEVHTLSDAEQAALLALYDAEAVGHRRIIATSSVENTSTPRWLSEPAAPGFSISTSLRGGVSTAKLA